jgi:hypothetical protein
MKKLLIGTVALGALGAGVTANAADIAVPRGAAYVAPVAYTPASAQAHTARVRTVLRT